MDSFWVTFQGRAGETFATLFNLLPGSPLVQLTLFSAVLGIMLIWLYKFVSFQNKLASLKRRITTVALEPFLFKDSTRISLLTPLRLFYLAATYLALSIPPLLVLAFPVVWLLGLTNQVIGYETPHGRDQIAVSISGESSRDIRQLQMRLEGSGYTVTPLVRSFHSAEAWSALEKTSETDQASLTFALGNSAVAIPILGNGAITVPVLTQSGWNRLLFPGIHKPLPAGIKEISVDYPSRYFEILGIAIPWTVLFLMISMASGLIFAKIFRIQV